MTAGWSLLAAYLQLRGNCVIGDLNPLRVCDPRYRQIKWYDRRSNHKYPLRDFAIPFTLWILQYSWIRVVTLGRCVVLQINGQNCFMATLDFYINAIQCLNKVFNLLDLPKMIKTSSGNFSQLTFQKIYYPCISSTIWNHITHAWAFYPHHPLTDRLGTRLPQISLWLLLRLNQAH